MKVNETQSPTESSRKEQTEPKKVVKVSQPMVVFRQKCPNGHVFYLHSHDEADCLCPICNEDVPYSEKDVFINRKGTIENIDDYAQRTKIEFSIHSNIYQILEALCRAANTTINDWLTEEIEVVISSNLEGLGASGLLGNRIEARWKELVSD